MQPPEQIPTMVLVLEGFALSDPLIEVMITLFLLGFLVFFLNNLFFYQFDLDFRCYHVGVHSGMLVFHGTVLSVYSPFRSCARSRKKCQRVKVT